MPEATVAAAASVEDIRRDFYEQGPGKDTFWWIEEMFLAPSEVIAMDDETGELKKIPFTVAEDESITWGEAKDVKREYVEASARTPDAVWTSRDESAALGEPETPAAPGDTTTDEGKDTMEFTEDQADKLTAALGLGDDATAADIVTAVEKLASNSTTEETKANKENADLADEAIVAAAKKRGFNLVSASSFDTMQKQLAELQDDKRHRIVEDAIAAGKFMPSARNAAIEQMRAGLLTEETIAAMSPIVTVAGAEVGHGHTDDNTEPEDVRETDVYKNWIS